MNTITITLCASTRTGCLSAPIHSCADERLTLAGDVTLSAGTSVALLTPRGNTLAHTILSEECPPGATIPLSTLTAQAAEYTRSCRAGDTREALLAIGDSEHPLALIPARIAQNPLYTLAPPTDLAPAYPTTETLKSLLAEMQAASTAAAQSATAARNSATEAGESASSAASDRATAVYAATSAQAYAEVATAAQARSSTSASEASTSAANAASSADSARDAASSAISAANSAAGSATKAAASSDSAAFALTASKNAANSAEVSAEKAREADISAASSAAAASQSATSAAQAAAADVATLLQGKVDAAETAKAGAEAAKAAAETAKSGAEAAKAAAASSATAAANSAAAAAKSATDLAEAVATAESLDGRIGALEAGTGAYIIQSRDVIPYGKPTSADVGKVLYFDHFASETTSTLAVTNRTPWAQKVCPAPIVANGENISVIGCFDYTKNKKYIIFASGISINKISYLYELSVGESSSTLAFKSKLYTSNFSGGYGGGSPAEYCRAYCVHDGFVFYTRRHYSGGPYLCVCDVETGKAVSEFDLDPKDTGGIYVNSAIWYNPLSGHICVLCQAFSLPTGETWGSNNASSHFIRVFSWDRETKTLSDIPNGDSPATVIDVMDAFAEGGVIHVGNANAYGPTWAIRDQVFVAIQGRSYMALFHATADDRIEPCYEWDVAYEIGDDGITRPVWETQPEEWTDADGNVQTIQNYVRNYYYDKSLVPKMTKGRLLKFCAATDYEGPPSGTWAANPMFFNALNCYDHSQENVLGKNMSKAHDAPSHIILTNGVERWKMFDVVRFVNLDAFNNLNHLKDPGWYDGVEYAPARDEATGVYLLNDVRKGSARKYTGWLPKREQYITNVGSKEGYDIGTSISILTSLTAAQSGTPLSRIGMVRNAGTDSAVMTPLPITATYNSNWWLSSMLPYCPFGFFGNVWATTYSKTIGGVL